MSGCVEISISGKNSEVVEIISSSTVVAVCVLKLAKVVQGSDLFKSKLRYRMLT